MNYKKIFVKKMHAYNLSTIGVSEKHTFFPIKP